MSRDKQIEELEEEIKQAIFQEWKKGNAIILETRDAYGIAEHLINAGYRKQSECKVCGEKAMKTIVDLQEKLAEAKREVAEETLKEVRELYMRDDRYAALERRLKKKYTESEK